jgi:hypothetical protein
VRWFTVRCQFSIDKRARDLKKGKRREGRMREKEMIKYEGESGDRMEEGENWEMTGDIEVIGIGEMSEMTIVVLQLL